MIAAISKAIRPKPARIPSSDRARWLKAAKIALEGKTVDGKALSDLVREQLAKTWGSSFTADFFSPKVICHLQTPNRSRNISSSFPANCRWSLFLILASIKFWARNSHCTADFILASTILEDVTAYPFHDSGAFVGFVLPYATAIAFSPPYGAASFRH